MRAKLIRDLEFVMDVNITMVPEAVAIDRLETKSQVLAHISQAFAEVYGLDQTEVLEGLEQREALGSTGFGRGVAIPHCRSAAVKRSLSSLGGRARSRLICRGQSNL